MRSRKRVLLKSIMCARRFIGTLFTRFSFQGNLSPNPNPNPNLNVLLSLILTFSSRTNICACLSVSQTLCLLGTVAIYFLSSISRTAQLPSSCPALFTVWLSYLHCPSRTHATPFGLWLLSLHTPHAPSLCFHCLTISHLLVPPARIL